MTGKPLGHLGTYVLKKCVDWVNDDKTIKVSNPYARDNSETFSFDVNKDALPYLIEGFIILTCSRHSCREHTQTNLKNKCVTVESKWIINKQMIKEVNILMFFFMFKNITIYIQKNIFGVLDIRVYFDTGKVFTKF
jgi:hypothetical protein